MQERILKFPKPLKENKNSNNEINSNQTRLSENAIKPKKILSNEELEEENKILLEKIAMQEKKLQILSKNQKIQNFFDIKSFLYENYKEFNAILNEYKEAKSSKIKKTFW